MKKEVSEKSNKTAKNNKKEIDKKENSEEKDLKKSKNIKVKEVKKVSEKAEKSESRTEKLLDLVIKCLDKNKAEDITVIDLRKKSSLTDYMIITSGRSQKQVGSLADLVAKEIKTKIKTTIAIEGKTKSDWAVLDFGDIILHIFHPEARSLYKIEEIWQD